MTASRVIAAALPISAALLLAAPLLVVQPGGAAAQRAPTDHLPTEPTANDPSVGSPSPPASDLKNPVGMAPSAARKEGTAPAAGNGPAEDAKDKR